MGVNTWTDEMSDIAMSARREGISASKVAAALNEQFGTKISRNAVIGKWTRMGVEPPEAEVSDEIRRLHGEGKTSAEIASALKMSQGWASTLQRRIGLVPHKPRPVHQWPQEQLAELKRLYIEDGLSASAVARIMKTTRSAIIGQAFRQGWSKPVLKRAYSRFNEPRAPKKAPVAPPPVDHAWDALGGSEPAPLVGRPFGACAWPVDGDGPDQLACCLPVAAGSYCGAHAAMAYRGLPERRALDKLGGWIARMERPRAMAA